MTPNNLPASATKTADAASYRMPAEWEKHSATWLTWPKNKITWPGKKLKVVEDIYLQMMKGLLPGEKVNLLVPDAATARKVTAALETRKAKTSNLNPIVCKTVDTWIRDYGPIFVLDKKRKKKAFTKWIFNAWGGKYSDLARDNKVVDRIASLKDFPRFDIPFILEGGSIDMNGQGICLTTEQCLLNPNRNPQFSKNQIEQKIKDSLGVQKVIWLKEGIEGDDTDGHVDDITRFVGPNTIITAVEPDARDKNHEYLSENLHILKSERNLSGKPFRVIELPMPGRIGDGGRDDSDHERLPASYANFYIGNAAVLVPVYSHRNDREAVRIVQKAFPGRKAIGIECTDLVYGLGSIHCVTQQEPA